MKMVRLTGMATHGRLFLSGHGKYRKQRTIPQYFTIEVDLNSIRERKKGEKA